MELGSLFQLAVPVMLRGTAYTLLFAVASMVLGLALGGLITLVRVLQVPLLQQVARLYVSAFRGTPLLVQVFIIYYGLPSIGIEFSPVAAGILALTLNVAAYLSESLRGAVLGVGQGQWMAGKSLGLTHVQTLRHVIGPQALRIATPSLSNSPAGKGSPVMSWRRTSRFSRFSVSRNCVSRSVASTRPAAPTSSLRRRAIEPPPAPTSQHRQPGANPRARRQRRVVASKRSDKAAKRVAAFSDGSTSVAGLTAGLYAIRRLWTSSNN